MVELEVTADHAVPVTPTAGGTITVLNQSGDTLYYADNPQVSAANNQGSLTAGNSATLSLPQWIRSASLTAVQVTVNDPVAPTGSGASAPATIVATSGASQTLSFVSGADAGYDITFSANCAVSFTGAVAGKLSTILAKLRQPSVGGPFTYTLSGNIESNVVPQNATPSAYDVVAFSTMDGGTTVTAVVVASSISPPTAPGAPTGLSVAPSNTQNVVTWVAPTNNGGSAITGYKLLRSTSSGAETLYQTLGNVLTFTDTGLTNGTTYFYEVQAVNVIGTSVASGEASGTPSGGFVNDTFAGTAGTLITAAHSGQVTGATWTAHPSSTGTEPVITNANRLRTNSTGSSSSVHYASGTKVSADYTVQATIRVFTEVANQVISLLGRVDTTVATYYSARYNVGAGGGAAKFELYKFVSGTATLLGSFTNELSLATDHTMALTMTGSSISVVVDGSAVITVTDSAVTASGRVGVGFFQPSADTTGAQLSNYIAV